MTSFSRLDSTLHQVNQQITLQEDDRKQYNALLLETLQTYLLNQMEEEDEVYDLLYQCMQYVGSSYENLKIRVPNAYDLNFVLVLGVLPEDIMVEYDASTPGYVRLKLPDDLEDELQKSRVWRDACNRRIQHTLLSRLDSWKDSSNYLLQSSMKLWFGEIVDKAIASSTFPPNFQVRRLDSPSSIVLEVQDNTNSKFTITMQPVIAFPISQVPLPIAANIDPHTHCNDEWMVECRPHPSGRGDLWGMSFWQQERKFMNDKHSMKPVLRLVKALRDGCEWSILTSYTIKTLFMWEQKRQEGSFWRRSLGDILMHMLTQLRNRVVSPEGIPFYWDPAHNLLSGLTGPQRANLSRAVENARSKLEQRLSNPSVDVGCLFGVSIPSEPEASRDSSAYAARRVSSPSQPVASRNSNSYSEPRPQFVSTSSSSAGGLRQEEQQGSGWLWALGGVAAVAAGAAALYGIHAARRNNNNN